MQTMYTREELENQIETLRNKLDVAQQKRVELLKKYSSRTTPTKAQENANIQLHDLERKLESLENKLDKLL